VIIAGLRPCSFIDYPGKLAAVAFTHGCNLRCRYCHNPELLDGAPPRRIEEDEILRLLARRRGSWTGSSSPAVSRRSSAASRRSSHG
jgi:pyruvate formate lyase activating enzyme